MKATEIMLGDWLQGVLPDTLSRVAGIPNEYRVAVLAGRAYIELDVGDLQPIPITGELLERAGFEKREVRVLAGTKTHYCLGDDYFALAIDEHTDSIWEVEYTNCEAHFPLVRVLIAFVHELQHALKLVGVEKEIEL